MKLLPVLRLLAEAEFAFARFFAAFSCRCQVEQDRTRIVQAHRSYKRKIQISSFGALRLATTLRGSCTCALERFARYLSNEIRGEWRRGRSHK